MFRKIKNQLQFRCFPFHTYTRWIDKKRGEIRSLQKGLVGYYVQQERTCQKCGKVQLRVHRTETLYV